MPFSAGNQSHPQRQQGASTAVDYVELANLAKRSYQAAEEYGALLTFFNDTYAADPDLCDADGAATEADLEVIAIRDEIIEYCKTTAGRYELAGAQLEQALRDYMDADDQAAEDIQRALDDWTANGNSYGSSDPSWNEDEYADATARPDGANQTAPEGFSYDQELSGEDA